MPLTFSSELYQERFRLHMTQSEAANLCGVSLRSYSDWENDQVDPLEVAKEGALERMRKADPKGPKK